MSMFVIYAFLTSGTIAIFLTLFNGLSGMAMPAINAMMSQRTPPDQQGELQGMNGSLSALSFLFAQLVYNNVLAYFTSDAAPFYFPGATFLIAASIAAIALVALIMLARRNTVAA
jgi:DHA1 family tetracycline resistance protein-like MFS transporter